MKRMFLVLGLVAATLAGCSSRSAVNAKQEARKAAAKEEAAKKAATKVATAKESPDTSESTSEKQPKTESDQKKSDSTDNQIAVATAALPSDTANGAADAAGPPQLELGFTGDMSPADAQKLANKLNRPGDWNQWGGAPLRNSVVSAKVPTEWEIGEFDADTGAWVKEGSKNIKSVALLGSQTYGNVVVANGNVFVGTNNGAAYLKRYPADIDLGVLVCFDENNLSFLWQDNSEKLHTGRVHDWPLMGICSSPLVEGDRLYYVTSRGEVKCLDTKGFIDGDNDGPFKQEKVTEKDEADVIWVLDMMSALEVSQHNMANCSITSAGDYLFVLTSNGVDDAHINLPSPNAPSFIAVDKRNGKVLWTDNSPGPNVLHGQWSSPAYAVIGDVPQVIMPGGDGWLYGFDARGENGKSKLLWKFDCNPKESKYTLGGRADRNHLIATPVIYNNRVFVGVGEDPEHGEGVGHLWCVDPTKRGDVSPELVYNTSDPEKPIAHKRNQALVKSDGDFSRPNPNSAAIWHYANHDKNGDGKFDFEETMHRTCGTVAIKDDLVVIADFSGLVHCLDANTGKPHWTHDMLAASWGSPLIAGDHAYIGDEDGDVSIIKLGKELDVAGEINMGSAVYSTPIVANGVLYITSKSYLFAISDTAATE
jgi:outer membrane protein assembly factor BamB